MNAAKEIANCKVKRRYDSEGEANLAARCQMLASYKTPDLRTYYCKWCEGWHLTKNQNPR